MQQALRQNVTLILIELWFKKKTRQQIFFADMSHFLARSRAAEL